jgi:aspartate carbamoyltransferase catalytic subunit
MAINAGDGFIYHAAQALGIALDIIDIRRNFTLLPKSSEMFHFSQ